MKFKKFYYLKENKQKPLEYAIFNDEVRKAFFDFVELAYKDQDWVLIGGLCMGVYATPRNTSDVDIALLSDQNIEVLEILLKSKFRKFRSHAFEHKNTGVEIEIVTPTSINVPQQIFQKLQQNAAVTNMRGKTVKIATPKYLIAMKLFRAIDPKNPKSYYDKGDILNLLKIYGIQDLSDLPMPENTLKLYNELEKFVAV